MVHMKVTHVMALLNIIIFIIQLASPHVYVAYLQNTGQSAVTFSYLMDSGGVEIGSGRMTLAPGQRGIAVSNVMAGRGDITFTAEPGGGIEIIQSSTEQAVDRFFSLSPFMVMHGYVWQVVSCMFLHGSLTHILFNMFSLLVFGAVVEEALGKKRYLTLYFISGIGSSLLYIGLSLNGLTPMLGASGAIFGVVTAYAFMFPKNLLFIPPGIPVPAWLFVIGFAVISLFSGMLGLGAGIAHWGHLGGIITGFLFMLRWRRRAARRSFEFVWE
jgi:membrane associated rhomboid family serine protease